MANRAPSTKLVISIVSLAPRETEPRNVSQKRIVSTIISFGEMNDSFPFANFLISYPVALNELLKLSRNILKFQNWIRTLFTILTSRRIEFSLILPLIFVDIRVTNPPVSRVKPRYTALHCKSWKLIENKLGQRWRSHAKRSSPSKSINIHTDLSVGINYPLLPSLPIIRTYLR